MRFGGLGIGSAVMLAPSAFLASASGAFDLIHQILPDSICNSVYHAFDVGLDVWEFGHSSP